MLMVCVTRSQCSINLLYLWGLNPAIRFIIQALFEHRNVLSLIGIITTPRAMPVMLVLAHCDNGSLYDHVRTQGEESSTSTKLTFCAEVAQGMEYIASRRVVRLRVHCLKTCRYSIVVDQTRCLGTYSQLLFLAQIHRDVAARNILLDAMLVCKVGE